jgi:site-specific DNA recombinase
MTKPAAIYARVSSDRQKEDHTIASQTAALIQYAETEGFVVPKEWIFQDEGYSGANIVRPGLEAVRDLAAEGHIEAVLIHSPDRLSRKYAYQVLLAEEFSKHGVELRFVKSPSVITPEDQLLVQFQGMIAEYERAQILERSRRGKRHRAQQGSISVLSGAPYGYRYVKKTDSTAAYYEVVGAEADVVRLVFQTYIEQAASINEITRMLNERQIPTRRGIARWERSTVWAMLRNPAYAGRACFGKTELRPRQRITRPLRQRQGHATRNSANHERPHQDWIEIPVPALVGEATFALAQEQLERNKHHSPRRTVEPSLLQGMLVCEKCGYALYRSSAQTSKQKLYYYRCLGSDAYRYRPPDQRQNCGGPVRFYAQSSGLRKMALIKREDLTVEARLCFDEGGTGNDRETCLKDLAPQEGLEPTTLRLTAGAHFVNRKSQLPVLYDRDRKINS